ncbi:ABC transporter ATP-binding protein [Jiangella sp. DSM 45060]|uniref:ATP-binding cassette domain-containing protein n=1 Tax=Jiangella sp. DSM 45060 TaxID=1798224 RepID=UPI00087D4C81|nr:ABC transporter ATP-binding protein [Jiangella sp. DSM 45060]SDS52628.1 peptide/nickel transport system ATP-binding protein [Jiangella sp. DSM 45060]
MADTPVLDVAGLEVGNDADRPFTLGPLDLALAAREIVGVVGDSGAGKSLLVSTLTQTLRPSATVVSGQVRFEDADLLTLDHRRQQRIRGARIGFIGSNPHGLLHPMLPVGRQVANVLRAHEAVSRTEARARVLDMFSAVGIPDPSRRLDAYPHELSGGMAQRVVIAVGLICDPDLIVADEPTAGLDVTIQAQVLELIEALVRSRENRALLLATRDLGIVARFCDRVVVLDDGRVAEQGPVRDLFRTPEAAISRELLTAARGF